MSSPDRPTNTPTPTPLQHFSATRSFGSIGNTVSASASFCSAPSFHFQIPKLEAPRTLSFTLEGSNYLRVRSASISPEPSAKPEAESTGTTPIPVDALVVDAEDIKELTCGICLQILSKPHQCKNGHLFCKDCISMQILNSPECPQCRCTLRQEDLGHCLYAERHVQQLKVWCKHHVRRAEDQITGECWETDEDGCNAIFPLETVSQHEKNCGYAFVSCKYSAKCERIRKKDIAKHEETCKFRPLECPHCKQLVESSKMEDHLANCKCLPVDCPKCNLQIQRGDVEHHKKVICPEETVTCQFADRGCDAKMKRKALKDHLNEQAGLHLSLLKSSMDEVAHMKQMYETQLKVRDDKIKLLEKTLSEIDTKIDWRIKNWSTMKKRSYIQSDKFNFAEYNWFIGFYSDGDNEESRGYLSVYLFLDVGNMPKGKNVTIEFQLRIVNHKDPNDSVRKEFKTTFPIKGGQGWGDRKAIKACRITEEDGFLKLNTLHMEAQIILKKVCWNL